MKPHPTHRLEPGIWRCLACSELVASPLIGSPCDARCVPVDDGDAADEPAEDYRAPEDWSGVVAF